MDRGIEVAPQGQLLHGEAAGDEAAGELLHDRAAGEPVEREDGADGEQDQEADAQHQRRHQREAAVVLSWGLGFFVGQDFTHLRVSGGGASS